MTLSQMERPAKQKRSTHLKVALFLDGANLQDMEKAAAAGLVQGYTTNPTLVAKAGVPNYREFARQALERIGDAPISFEVIADDLAAMEQQAREIASWAPNINVKVPITNTKSESAIEVVRRLTDDGISVNITAMMTLDQVARVAEVVNPDVMCFASVFAGRVADTGVDPVPMMREAVQICRARPNLKVLWASPREVLNVYQADECGVHVIVLTADLIAKLALRNKDLTEYSRETVQMFYDDAQKAGYTL
jgi:transaldolase